MKLLSIVLICAVLTGCAYTKTARLYDLKDGKITEVEAKIKGNRANLRATLPSGEFCQGECVTGQAVSHSWGSIYYAGKSGSYSGSSYKTSNTGAGIMVCNQGTTFNCEYVVSGGMLNMSVYGVCLDNRGNLFRLLF